MEAGASASRPIRVLVVEPSWPWREAVLRLFERRDREFDVSAASDVEAGRRLVRSSRPDVVIVDLDDKDSQAFLKELHEREIPSIAWAATPSQDDLVAALGAGASYVLKPQLEPERLCQLVTIVADGDALMLQASRRALNDLINHHCETPVRRYALTPREAEVLGYIAHGRTNAEIAEALHLAPSSVKKLVSRLLRRLGVRNRVEAALLARIEGLSGELPDGGHS